MPLSEAQKNALDAYRIIADHAVVPDHTSASPSLQSSEENPEWMNTMTQLAMHYGQAASYAANQSVPTGGNFPGGVKKKIISASGFPEGVRAAYTPCSPLGCIPWTKSDDREIKQLVIHSFGHGWHAYKVGSSWRGRMNEPGGAQPVYIPFKDNIRRAVYVAKGTNYTDGSMSNPDRFSAGFQYALFASTNTVGCHFFIDRSGNIYIMADCNDVINSALELSNTSIGVSLEEALYSETLPTRDNPATWLADAGSDGNPGTAGTLKYFSFSDAQLLTLSVLIKKLQLVYPNLQVMDHSTGIGSMGPDSNGYALHAHIKQTKNVDPSPHFMTEEEWSLLFALVNTHELTADTVFVKPLSGAAARMWWVSSLSVPTNANNNALGSMVSADPIYTALSVIRATNIVNKKRGDYNLNAGNQASEDGKQVRNRLANLKVLNELANAPPEEYDGESV